MTDQAPEVIITRDEGIAVEMIVSGSVGVSPNRPVCVTGNMRVHQITCVADRYIGVVGVSGAEGDPIAVYQKGTVKAYVTGTVSCGDLLIATGSSTAASFKTASSIAAESGTTYWTSNIGNELIAAKAMQNGADGEPILVKLL